MKNALPDLRRPGRSGGFTLIEVMCSVVVLGIGIAAILGLIAQATRAVSTARGATVQVALARQAMVEVENLYWQRKADEIETSGDFGPDFPDYRYEVNITEDIDEKVTGLQLVELTVFWDRGTYEREYTLTTYLIDFSK